MVVTSLAVDLQKKKESNFMEASKKQTIKRVDMLHGSLLDRLLLFALPLAVSSILQQLFNSVDVAVVGHFASNQAQAAVGCNGPVINLIINLFVGISVGANVVIASYIGQKEKEKVSQTIHTAMLVAIISGVFLIAVGLLIARPLLILMDTPEDVLEYAIRYLHIYFLGMPFIMIYNFGAAILRSIGDSKRPLYCLLLSGVVNAGLNLFLVIVFHLDVAGVAIATVISNIISATMVWYFLTKEEGEMQLAVTKSELVKILRIGIPAGLQGMVFSVSNVCVQSVLNSFGSDAVAGSAVAINYEYFSFFIISAFNQTAVTFTSQNYGAGQYERCKKIFRLTFISSILFTICMSLTFVAGRYFFASLFTPDSNVVEYAVTRMSYILLFNFLTNTYEIGGAALRGIGYSMTPAVLTVFGTCLFRLLWIYTVCRKYHSFEVLLSVYPVSWAITGAAVLTAYFVIRKKVFCKKEGLQQSRTE